MPRRGSGVHEALAHRDVAQRHEEERHRPVGQAHVEHEPVRRVAKHRGRGGRAYSEDVGCEQDAGPLRDERIARPNRKHARAHDEQEHRNEHEARVEGADVAERAPPPERPGLNLKRAVESAGTVQRKKGGASQDQRVNDWEGESGVYDDEGNQADQAPQVDPLERGVALGEE